jgi:MFS family permease
VTHTAAASRKWYVVGLLTLGVIIGYMDRINLSSALPLIRESIPLSPSRAGLVLSAFFWSYAALHVPAGWVIDRIGVKKTFAIAFSVWSVAAATTAFVTSFGGLILIRLLLGAGESATLPAGIRYIRTNFPEHQRGLAAGTLMAGTKYGPALGAPLATYLMLTLGWRSMFALMGLAALLWLIPWLLYVDNDDPGTASTVTHTTARTSTEPVTAWRSLVLTPVMWGTFLGTFCYNYFVFFSMTWMPTYFKESQGLSLTDSGWFTFMSFFGMATIAIMGGWAADTLIVRGGNPVTVRKAFTMAGFALALTVVFGALTSSATVSLFFAVFSMCGLGLATANYWTLTQTLMPSAAAGRVAGIQNVAASLGGIVSPWIAGVLVERTGTFDAPLLTIGFWLALGLGSYLFLVRQKYAPV